MPMTAVHTACSILIAVVKMKLMDDAMGKRCKHETQRSNENQSYQNAVQGKKDLSHYAGRDDIRANARKNQRGIQDGIVPPDGFQQQVSEHTYREREADDKQGKTNMRQNPVGEIARMQ